MKSDILVAYIICDHPGLQLAESITSHIAQHLSDYKMPRYLYFVDMLPYTARGKLIRNQLSELKHIFEYETNK